MLGLMFRRCLEILSNFQTRVPTFSVCTGPVKSMARPNQYRVISALRELRV